MAGIISIRGARQHNLKGIDLDLPKNSLIVITGVSGSGKSSLAFDTLYAEGQRRYVESLSPYARQFLNLHARPDVDSIDGLSPAISVSQKHSTKNPRSTVSTVTETHDYLRLMYARIGIPHSPATGKPIIKMSPSRIVQEVSKLPIGTKIHIMSPVVKTKPGDYNQKITEMKKLGYARVKVNGQVYDINDEVPKLSKNESHEVYIVVDRVSLTSEKSNRIASSIENALSIGNGVVHIELVAVEDNVDNNYFNGQVVVFSESFVCPESGFTIPEVEPRLFSFNTIHGSCKHCLGIGKSRTVDASTLVTNANLSILDGAIDPVGPIRLPYSAQYESSFVSRCVEEIIAMSKKCGLDLSTAWCKMEQKDRDLVLFGSQTQLNSLGFTNRFNGVVALLNEKGNLATEKIAERYMASSLCEHCMGFRLSPEALSVKIDNKHIGEVCSFSVEEAVAWCESLPNRLSEFENTVAAKLLEEIVKRLTFLRNVGLGHLTLDRESRTLSGGESQRIKLASQIGSGLTGVLYVLDEPSIGLHQRDNALLIKTLKNLRDMGNTVVVIEHDDETMANADYIVDVGPGAGEKGGRVVAQGTPKDIAENQQSITGQYLSRRLNIIPSENSEPITNWIEIIGARKNNLRNIEVKIPIGRFTCVTGVSGSGKSSLIADTLYKYAVHKVMGGALHADCECDYISGLDNIDKVIEIDQSPIGRTPSSNPATYVGLFSHIRSWFSGLPIAKSRGYTVSRFSFNSKGGRCEACKGDGCVKIEMHFLPDVYVKCGECNGLRYNQETLEVKYKDKSIADILDMTVDQALDFFAAIPLIREKLESLKDVGMGYAKIGQSSTTLSGGESQRVKLSKELSKRSTGRTLYILDEPTTGLHISDIQNLLRVLRCLTKLGNTVVVIEHNLHVIKTANYMIDIGPEGGDKGGQVVATGHPREVVTRYPESITAQYLAQYFEEDRL